jgi:hypothetical protein
MLFIWIQLNQRAQVQLLTLLSDEILHQATSDKWYSSYTQTIASPQAEFYASFEGSRVWTQTGDRQSTPRITQRVFQYNSPIRAVLQYHLSRPEAAYRGEWPNFTFEDLASRRYPQLWEYQNDNADQTHVVCAMGDSDACQLWYYWARYGQYLISIQFFAPNAGIDAESFAKMVHEIDARIHEQLER